MVAGFCIELYRADSVKAGVIDVSVAAITNVPTIYCINYKTSDTTITPAVYLHQDNAGKYHIVLEARAALTYRILYNLSKTVALEEVLSIMTIVGVPGTKADASTNRLIDRTLPIASPTQAQQGVSQTTLVTPYTLGQSVLKNLNFHEDISYAREPKDGGTQFQWDFSGGLHGVVPDVLFVISAAVLYTDGDQVEYRSHGITASQSWSFNPATKIVQVRFMEVEAMISTQARILVMYR